MALDSGQAKHIQITSASGVPLAPPQEGTSVDSGVPSPSIHPEETTGHFPEATSQPTGIVTEPEPSLLMTVPVSDVWQPAHIRAQELDYFAQTDPEALKARKEQAIGLVPVYGTVRHWKEMEPWQRGVSVAGDVGFVAGMTAPLWVPKIIPPKTATVTTTTAQPVRVPASYRVTTPELPKTVTWPPRWLEDAFPPPRYVPGEFPPQFQPVPSFTWRVPPPSEPIWLGPITRQVPVPITTPPPIPFTTVWTRPSGLSEVNFDDYKMEATPFLKEIQELGVKIQESQPSPAPQPKPKTTEATYPKRRIRVQEEQQPDVTIVYQPAFETKPQPKSEAEPATKTQTETPTPSFTGVPTKVTDPEAPITPPPSRGRFPFPPVTFGEDEERRKRKRIRSKRVIVTGPPMERRTGETPELELHLPKGFIPEAVKEERISPRRRVKRMPGVQLQAGAIPKKTYRGREIPNRNFQVKI